MVIKSKRFILSILIFKDEKQYFVCKEDILSNMETICLHFMVNIALIGGFYFSPSGVEKKKMHRGFSIMEICF